MTDFIEEISGFVVPQLGVIEMDRLGIGRVPTLAHQRERSDKQKGIHDICRHVERSKFPFGIFQLVPCDFFGQVA